MKICFFSFPHRFSFISNDHPFVIELSSNNHLLFIKWSLIIFWNYNDPMPFKWSSNDPIIPSTPFFKYWWLEQHWFYWIELQTQSTFQYKRSFFFQSIPHSIRILRLRKGMALILPPSIHSFQSPSNSLTDILEYRIAWWLFFFNLIGSVGDACFVFCFGSVELVRSVDCTSYFILWKWRRIPLWAYPGAVWK